MCIPSLLLRNKGVEHKMAQMDWCVCSAKTPFPKSEHGRKLENKTVQVEEFKIVWASYK